MNREEIHNKLKTILSEQLGLEPEQVTETATFEELGADSLDNIEIVMAVEEEFELSIPDEEAEAVKSVSQAIDSIANHLA